MFKPNSCRVSSYGVLNISRGIYSLGNSKETPHDSPIRAGYGVSFFSSQTEQSFNILHVMF